MNHIRFPLNTQSVGRGSVEKVSFAPNAILKAEWADRVGGIVNDFQFA